ncbi:MAG: lipopolysaccharide biosynthesis protein [Sphingobacterium composti]|uniref:lipopolysaccharide biosynthesis protein n=1 Tax=Sphingobacterium composti TaxID=363260 RepID=UPI00135B9D4D|nr:lipopolysaccharide biosynthesis protein [Sphingobacterium composti Ten et al. 2007 non Yoo et al. 2007]
MSIIRKTKFAFIWSILQQFSVKFIGLVINIFLARILSPSDFGLIAMLSVFILLGNSLLDSGLASSLVRSRMTGQKDYSTVFIFNLIGGVTVYGILCLSAPFIADFYRQPLLIDIIKVYGLTFIVNSFFSIQNTLLIKDMRFKQLALTQIPAVTIGGCLGIFLATRDYGVWSLVWMNLSASIITTLIHWCQSSWRPKLIFDKKSFHKHFYFGYKMTLTGLLDTVYKNLYTIIIGRFYAVIQLGYYARADSLSQLPIGIIATAINKVAYPMFSSFSQDDEKLKKAYKMLMQQVLYWNAPSLILLAIIAKPLIVLLITDKWLPVVPYFQILCIAGIMYPLHSYNLNILKVKGQSGQILKLEIIKKVLMVIGIVCVFPFGIMGLLYFQIFFTVFAYYINSIYSGKLINYPLIEQVKDIYPILLLSGLLGLVVFYCDQLVFAHLSNILRIILSGITYGGLYLVFSQLFKLSPLADFKQIILKK